MKRSSRVFAGLAAVVVAGTVHADAAGDKVAASVIEACSRAKTLYVNYEVSNIEPGKAEKKMELEVRYKGGKCFLEFLGPADMKGTKFLQVDANAQYVYLPAFGKVRRIASTIQDQAFLGCAFAAEQILNPCALVRLNVYDVKIAAERADAYDIVATAKAGQAPSFAKIEATVGKGSFLASQIKYYDAKGVLQVTETRSGWTTESNVMTPGRIDFVNAKGVRTALIRKKLKVNEAMADDIFSKRNIGE